MVLHLSTMVKIPDPFHQQETYTNSEMNNDPQGTQPIDVDQVIMVMIDQMAGIAWQKLGLQNDLITGKIEKDLTQAKTAVDVVSQLSEFIIPQLDDSDKRQIQTLVSNLKINYIQKLNEVNS
jgi:hypothetical protein